MTRFLLLAATLALLIHTPVAAQAAPPERVKKVLIIGIDGLRVDALEQADTPVLDDLAQEGFRREARILGMRYNGSDTVSGAGWSSILTGVWADKHGVNDNAFRAPRFEKYPHLFAHVKAANPMAQTISLVSWTPIDETIVSAADIHRVIPEVAPADPSPAAEAAAQVQMDDAMRDAAVDLLRTENPTAMFVYFHQTDGTGHAIGYGPETPEYMQAVENIDADIGAVLEALRARPTYSREDWLILVTTDHGGTGTGHNKGHDDPHVAQSFIIASGAAIEGGQPEGPVEIVDVAPTALAHLGIAINPRWGLDGRSLIARVDTGEAR